MKENCGNLAELNALEEEINRPYTIEQMLNPKLKCTNGESMEEVKKFPTNYCKNNNYVIYYTSIKMITYEKRGIL